MKIGDKYEGGIIFLISTDGKEVLVAEDFDRKGLYTWNDAMIFTNEDCDWYLPNKEELNQLYLQRGVVGCFAYGFYWSSTEVGADSAWRQGFYSGSQNWSSKAYGRWVRLIKRVKLNMKKKVEKYVAFSSLEVGDIIKLNNCYKYEVVYVSGKQFVYKQEDGFIRTAEFRSENFLKLVYEEVPILVDGVEALKAYKEGKRIKHNGYQYQKDQYHSSCLPNFIYDDWEILE